MHSPGFVVFGSGGLIEPRGLNSRGNFTEESVRRWWVVTWLHLEQTFSSFVVGAAYFLRSLWGHAGSSWSLGLYQNQPQTL